MLRLQKVMKTAPCLHGLEMLSAAIADEKKPGTLGPAIPC